MEWNARFELGLEPMDATHREFFEVLNGLAESDSENRLDRLDAFIAHTVAHFEQENRWMEAIDFPACHRAEHDRVLHVLQEVRARLVAGEPFFVQRVVEELPAWFANHADTMDAALAHTLQTVGFDFESMSVPARAGTAAAVAAGCGCATPFELEQAVQAVDAQQVSS